MAEMTFFREEESTIKKESFMFFGRRVLFALLVLTLGLAVTACQEKPADPKDMIFPIFGGSGNDISPVIAKVGDIEITQEDLDLRFDELVPKAQRNYEGAEGQQLLLKEMIDETILVLGALEKSLQDDQNVARALITHRRLNMISAMRNIGIPGDNKPTEDDMQAFFKDNRKEFMQEGMVHARHVECLTLERAMEAYKLIEENPSAYNFMKVAADYSVNRKSLAKEADLGWYNKTGIVADIKDSQLFVKSTFDLELGLNRPVQVVDRWHVVEILDRRPSRPMTYTEARALVEPMMLPAYYDGKIKDYVLAERKTTVVEKYGNFAPGKGMDPDALMKRATAVVDPGTKLDYYRLIYSDFPTSERADDALFMCALVCMDTWQDRRMAERYLDLLIEEYPESELQEDAAFLKENLYKPSGLNPTSIEELRNK